MLDNNTVTKLREMRLGTMASAFCNQLAGSDLSNMAFEERFGILVDAEWDTRRNNRLDRLIRAAGYSAPEACLEDIEYHADRNLDKAMLTRLGSCNYIRERHNVIILGATGSGKTYLANALGMAASRNFYAVRYIRLPDLLGELALARADGSYSKTVRTYKKADLLILDEWLLSPLRDNDAREILEITEARYKKASTVFCSQYDVGGWHEKIGDPTLADAICDRIAHDSYTVVIEGNESMRKRKGITAQSSGA
jgi:DNA replication protein DnaC